MIIISVFVSYVRMIKLRRMRMAGHVACKILVVKPEGNIPLGIHRSRWEHRPNSSMDPKGIGWEDVDWIHLVQDSIQFLALLNMVMIL
jgi:hypothetical protein